MLATAILQIMKTLMLLSVIGGGTNSQSNGGPSSSFNQFINNNSIMNNTAATESSSSSASSYSEAGSSVPSATGRNEDLLYQMRQRSRNHRLQSLRFQILSRLGMERPPSVTVSPETRNRVMETLDRFPALVQPPDTTDRRCYSASCGIPHKVNETLWRNSSDLGLRLFVPVPRDRNNGAELQSATLNLFLKPNAVRRVQCRCDCREEEAESSNCHSVTGLLVSVFQFIRPLSIRRRGRVVNRRRLLDAKFIPVSGNGWIVFNIGNVAMDWRRHRRNFGIEVTVKDDNETEIDAKTLFVPPDCSVGREVGCREGPNENMRQLPWFVNYRDNFPYVDLITTRQQEQSSARLKRSSRHRGQRHQKAVVHTAQPATEHVQPNLSCMGEIVQIEISDTKVAEPKTFQSRICPVTCWDCTHEQKCTARPCSPPRTQPVVGRYHGVDGPGPLTQLANISAVVACGC